jgi:hypothetical protein
VLLDGPITCVYKQLRVPAEIKTMISSSCVASLAALVGSGTSTMDGRCGGRGARGVRCEWGMCSLPRPACGADDPEASANRSRPPLPRPPSLRNTCPSFVSIGYPGSRKFEVFRSTCREKVPVNSGYARLNCTHNKSGGVSGSPLVLSDASGLPNGIRRAPVIGVLSSGRSAFSTEFQAPTQYLLLTQAHLNWLYMAAGLTEVSYYTCSSSGKIRTCKAYNPGRF